MSKPTVYAVMKVTIEMPVQPSSSEETFEQMFKSAQHEAERMLQLHLDQHHFRVVGPITFSHATVRGNP